MHVDVVSIFPELFGRFAGTSLLGRAIEAGRLTLAIHDLRDFTEDRHRVVDDEPYGGGGGMVMKAEPWIAAVRRLGEPRSASPSGASRGAEPWRVLLSPQGETLNEAKVRELARRERLLLLCARYEGVDQRVIDTVVDEEISIGDYVMAGGEVPAMVVIEAVSRQIPGVVGLPESVERDSFRDGLLDFPHYTRPRVVEGLEVPSVLLSGDHAAIEACRLRESLRATLLKRPDLLAGRRLDEREGELLEALRRELAGAAGPAGTGEGEDGSC
jgi:tRNA (guanine37-N1)-methyltransferase